MVQYPTFLFKLWQGLQKQDKETKRCVYFIMFFFGFISIVTIRPQLFNFILRFPIKHT
jgi:hypothetical protein